ncbi:MAG: quinol:cytochrome C oxidoreductase [Ignavibacteriaceae bacterium]
MSKIEAGYTKKALPEKVNKIGLILFAIGLIIGIAGYFIDSFRASYSYLISFMFLVSIGIGSLFLVALEYIAGASWSVPFRRISEFLSSLVPLLILLVIPLILNMHDLFHWANKEVVANDQILKGKSSYLNVPFFIIRTVVIFGLWSLFYFLLTKNSRKQDITKDQELTKKNIIISGVFVPLFAITISIISIDWLMSLEPHWFSTIFGVYFFSGAVLSSLAALTLITVLLNEKGFLHSKINTDHYYSLGTLMFAFTVFWAYIAFSQYMLIWYADLPEETSWFIHRWGGAWTYISIILILVHFVVPFASLLSFNSKTNPARLKFISVWILAAHFLDLYWLIMPSLSGSEHGYAFSWFDIVYPFAAVGLTIIIFNYSANKYNLVPIGDPKLERGLDFRL